ncbi:patatin-like phospholipase family protein [Micromonosporaceae bacterium Da 78-11]
MRNREDGAWINDMVTGGKALVLGGGGVTGVAWEIGLLLGLAEHGVDLSDAELLVGTSAGSVVAARVLSGVPLADLFEAQLAPPTGEIAARMSVGGLLKFGAAGLWPGDPAKGRAWLGRQSLKATTVTEAERRAVIALRVGRDDWPATPLLIPAIEALTGALKVFDKDSGVSLIDAVAASCAVPLTWPPMTVDGRRYLDGGARSVANVDLAAGSDRVVVIAPITASARRSTRPATQAAALGVPHVVLSPSDAARKRMGRNPLDPAFRAAAAEAGRTQAAREAEKVRTTWS